MLCAVLQHCALAGGGWQSFWLHSLVFSIAVVNSHLMSRYARMARLAAWSTQNATACFGVYRPQIADRLNADGVPCNLVTGQEIKEVPGARHTACTVEMADLDREVEVAVVDEVRN